MDSELKHINLLSKAQCAQVAEAIRAAELKTDAELVTVLIDKSDSYWFIPALWASIISLSLGGLSLFEGLAIQLFHGWNISTTDLFTMQWVSFIFLSILFRWPPLLKLLVPKHVKRQRAFQMARTQFLDQGLHKTRQSQGVLLFVSEFEHYVEVLADDGISSRIDNVQWQSIINRFVEDVANKQTLNGFIKAVEDIGALLEHHCPHTQGKGDLNELPNHMVVKAF